MANIAIINQSTLVSEADLALWLPALQQQLNDDYSPVWGPTAVLQLETQAVQGQWSLVLMDEADQPGDLGYHVDDTGVPAAKIFCRITQESGTAVSSVMSHELLEMMTDPACTRMDESGRYIVEVADPVEANYYEINGVTVSNFVTPEYFGLVRSASPRWDLLRELGGPCPMLLGGGYQMEWNGRQWISHLARQADGTFGFMSTRATGRSTYRASQAAPAALA